MIVTGTGLTHLGSAEGRDKMHKDLADPSKLTDSMRMFKMGLEGGKPAKSETGAQPEWFYKGDGSSLAAPEGDLPSPAFALDGGEEPEIVGIYLIDDAGVAGPCRVRARQRVLRPRHRAAELSLARAFEAQARKRRPGIAGRRSARRHQRHVAHPAGKEVIWEKPFLSGEQNMAHSIANLEAHHFKYGLFRRPGDVHVHFFGTATLSFSDGVKTQKGDVFEIESETFGLPLRNRLTAEKAAKARVRAL